MRLHVKVVVWLSDLNALLTKKLPKILSPLNETSCGREKMCLVSGSVRRILHRVAAIFKTKKKNKNKKKQTKKGHISSHLLLKSKLSLQRRLSLRN